MMVLVIVLLAFKLIYIASVDLLVLFIFLVYGFRTLFGNCQGTGHPFFHNFVAEYKRDF